MNSDFEKVCFSNRFLPSSHTKEEREIFENMMGRQTVSSCLNVLLHAI